MALITSDLDNCLVAGDDVVLGVDYHILQNLSSSSLPWDYDSFVARHGGKTFEQILRDTKNEIGVSLDDSAIHHLVADELDQVIQEIHRGAVQEVPGASKAITELVKDGSPVHVVSNSHRRRIEASLASIGVNDIIPSTHIKSAQSDYTPARPKPDPSCYADVVLAGMAHDPKHAWAIEDSVTGLQAATGARERLTSQLNLTGTEFLVVWLTHLVSPRHHAQWQQRALELRVDFEVSRWHDIPHLFDLVKSGKKAEAQERYGLRDTSVVER